MAHIEIHDEVTVDPTGGWQLCFHSVTYQYENDPPEDGYRFIWRRPDGSLQPARGQARIPSTAILLRLLAQAAQAGWLR